MTDGNFAKGLAIIAGTTAGGYLGARALLGRWGRKNPGPGMTAVLGDSITAKREGYVKLANDALADRSFTNMGVIGEGTASMKARMRRDILGRGYDEVIIEGGINDINRADARQHIHENLRAMVQEAKAQGLKVVLLTLPPWSRRPGEIRKINKLLRSQGRSWGADVVVDIHKELADPSGGLKAELIGDLMGLHPNSRGHAIIAEKILKFAYR